MSMSIATLPVIPQNIKVHRIVKSQTKCQLTFRGYVDNSFSFKTHIP